MAQVVFNPVQFKAMFPAFSGVDGGFLTLCFKQATTYLSNKDCSRVQDLEEREYLLWLLTAHIAQLMGALNPAGAAGGASAVGRTASATEGSVSVSFDFGPVSEREAWYSQTQPGAMYWAATAKYRAFRYHPRPTCF